MKRRSGTGIPLKQTSISRPGGRGPLLATGLALVLAGVAVPAAAQLLSQGAAGRALRITPDSAAARTVAKVYEGLFSYVRIERAEPGAPPNRHPVAISAAALTQLLAPIRLGSDALFNESELAEIVPPLVSALGRADAGQDVSFAVSGKHSGMAVLAPRSVTTGRLFRDEKGLQLIVGLAQRTFEDSFSATGVLIAFEPGRRSGPVDASIRLSDPAPGTAQPRADWLTLGPAGDGVATAAPASPVAPVAPIAPIAPIAPAAATQPAAAPAPTAATSPQPAAAADADARYRQISERLKTLQRLRDSGLISEQEYTERRRQILDAL